MAREIPEELKKFKEALDGKLSGVTSAASNISSKLGEVVSASDAARSDIEANYQESDGKSTASSKLSSLSSIVKSIGEDVTTTVSAAVSSAVGIISKVTEMETLITDMESQQSIINSEKGKKEPNTSRINTASNKIKEDETKFDELKAAAEGELSALKGMDKSVNLSGSSSSGASTTTTTTETTVTTNIAEYTKYLSQLKYGTFTEATYQAPNGIKIDYYIYKPDYGQDVKGLPVFMYMHGIGFEDKGKSIVTYGGLGEAIQKKTVTPSGIVVLPHVKNGKLYENAEYRKALASLAVQVSKDNNGDPNRISIGGTSYGAVTAFRLVNENPGVFSAVVNACGANDVTSAFKNVKVWNFNGRNEANNHTGKKYIQKQTEAVKSAGGSGQFTFIDNVWAHTKVGTLAFQNKYKDEKTGEMIYPFEWAFRQSKTESVSA